MPVAFDPMEPGFMASPYAQYRRLRTHDPVHSSTLLEGWVLTRYDDVVSVLRDPAVSIDLDHAQPTSLVLAEHARRPSTPAGRAWAASPRPWCCATIRIAMQATTIGGKLIEPGSVIYVCVGAANRDPARWGDDADAIRVDRPEAAYHVQFGMGIHSCLGTDLARLLAESMFTGLLRDLHDIELAAEPEWSPRMVLRGLQSLTITFAA